MGVAAQFSAIARHYLTDSRLDTLKNFGFPIFIISGEPIRFTLSLNFSPPGTKDKLIPFQNSKILKKILKPSRFRLLDGAGHMIHEVEVP